MIGPVQRAGAIVYDQIDSSEDFPKGWTDEQHPGSYRVRRNGDARLFGFTVGPHSWKKFLFPSTLKLFSAFRKGKTLSLEENGMQEKGRSVPKYAFFGVRSCELHAIEIQDKVFIGNAYQDPLYRSLRERLFVIVVNCTKPAETCFCSSMATGPKATKGFDLAFTEIADQGRQYYVVEAGSDAGSRMLAKLEHRPASEQETETCGKAHRSAVEQMKRRLDTTNIRDLLYRSWDHPEWEKVAARCLTCTNCTMVCPTCFCHSVDDTTDLAGSEAIRSRRWDSCFTIDFSYIHGGSIRNTVKARYRQWMTHKLASWIDQFGTSGCVGCGRCITWCPVGIDITEEAKIIRENQGTD